MAQKILKKALITIGMLSLFAGSALAGPKSMKRQSPEASFAPLMQMIKLVDSNGDGEVTKAEAQLVRGKMFDRMDRNGDAFLDRREQRFAKVSHKRKKRERRAAHRFDRRSSLDADSNGDISEQEFVHRPSYLFDRMDVNKDGVVSKKEQESFRSKQFARLDLNGDGILNRQDRNVAKDNKRSKVKTLKAKLDPDGDGRISRMDFVTTPGIIFEKIDVNGDLVLSQQEIQDAFESRRNSAANGRIK